MFDRRRGAGRAGKRGFPVRYKSAPLSSSNHSEVRCFRFRRFHDDLADFGDRFRSVDRHRVIFIPQCLYCCEQMAS